MGLAWCLVCPDAASIKATFEQAIVEHRPMLARRVVETRGVVDIDEAAGLALEVDVRSRLIEGANKKVTTGPLTEERLQSLRKDWTLLVNDAEKLLPSVNDVSHRLWSSFFASRRWLRDDAMLSVSSAGGGVGPHVDSSDVVLVQMAGRKKWSLEAEQVLDAESRRDQAKEARCLSDFQATSSWTLEPGDLLFVPARIPHEGIALDDECVTMSLGFRSYLGSELATRWIDHVDFDEPGLAAFEGLVNCADDGSIPRRAVLAAKDSVAQTLDAYLQDQQPFLKFLGQTLTLPREDLDDNDDACWDEVLADSFDCSLVEAPDVLNDHTLLLHHAAGSRLTYIEGDSDVLFFANGRTITLPSSLRAFASLLTTSPLLRHDQVRPFLADPAALHLIDTLLQGGDLIAMRPPFPPPA